MNATEKEQLAYVHDAIKRIERRPAGIGTRDLPALEDGEPRAYRLEPPPQRAKTYVSLIALCEGNQSVKVEVARVNAGGDVIGSPVIYELSADDPARTFAVGPETSGAEEIYALRFERTHGDVPVTATAYWREAT